MEHFSIEETNYGKELILHSSWDPKLIKYIRSNNIKGLYLNHSKGWKGDDLTFLQDLDIIESFKIIDFNINDIKAIHYLHSLRKLQLNTYDKTEIDFKRFPKIEECSLEWRPKAKSLFEAKTLKHLFINKYSDKDTKEFSKLTNLQSLSILNSPISDLNGLSNLLKLKFLGLYNLRKLTKLSGIEMLIALEELEINGCKYFNSINEISKLINLKKLQLCNDGEIETIRPIESLNDLESFLFYESTNVADGDLNPLIKLKKLNNIAFQDRKHYSHRRQDFNF